ncbi:MAG: hypothetical protein P8R00_04410 [Candidatus Poseidoniaceae archaeon]|nr:hypothetical protein [Candidatus Poseidoniaceae archaeon]
MGASVGIGGLIVGISMLVVFSMAISALDAQVATGLDAIESASVPDPSFTIDDVNIAQHVIHEVSMSTGNQGTGYFDGILKANVGSDECGGFSATFTTTGGEIDLGNVVITNHGFCPSSSTPTWTIYNMSNVVQTPTTPATFDAPVFHQYIYANITNQGSDTLKSDEVWVFYDGEEPETLTDSQDSSQSILAGVNTNWYSGETLELFWNDELSTNTEYERLAMTVGPTTLVRSTS